MQKILAFSAAVFALTVLCSEKELTYRTPRRSIREVLSESPLFNDDMLEELLISSDEASLVNFSLPMNHLMFDDLQGLIEELLTEFPELFKREVIGKTYEGRDMVMLEMTLRNESIGRLRAP